MAEYKGRHAAELSINASKLLVWFEQTYQEKLFKKFKANPNKYQDIIEKFRKEGLLGRTDKLLFLNLMTSQISAFNARIQFESRKGVRKIH